MTENDWQMVKSTQKGSKMAQNVQENGPNAKLSDQKWWNIN